MRIAVRLLALLSLLPVLLLGAVAAADPTGASTSLPEPEGVQGIAANDFGAYVVYADSPRGHVAAVSGRTGKVAWRSPTADRAALIAATPTVVWTAGEGAGGLLVAKEATTGRTLHSFVAPGGGGWDTLSTSGDETYALSHSPDLRHETLTSFEGAVRVRSVPVAVPSACQSAASTKSVYLACFSSVNAVYRVDPTTGTVRATTAPPGLQGGRTLGYLDGSVYVVTAPQFGDPGTVQRLDGSTLASRARTAAAMPISAITAAGGHLLALQSDGRSSGAVLDLDPTTLGVARSTPVPSDGYPVGLASDGASAFVVQTTAYAQPGDPFDTLLRLPL